MLDFGSLNPPQRAAVTTLDGPVLILAGAGTGKTRVITCRIAHLIEEGTAPGSILAVTFTNKAAREMQERVRQLVPRLQSGERRRELEGPTVCTFHSLCVRILRRHAERLGFKRNFVIYDEVEQLSAIKKILSRISDGAAKVDAGEVLVLLSRRRNAGACPAAWTGGPVARMAERIRSRYESALRACNAMDFDDLILYVLQLFAEHPDVLAECRGRWRHVMVDEYQDTNAAQFKLVHALTCEHRNLCVVGDDDQSIYGWRGAEVANLLDMERHYAEVKVVKLEQNYRSTNTILQVANALIRHNAHRRGKQLWSQKGPGSRIRVHVFEDEEEEGRTVVDEIEFDRRTKRIPWGSRAVLFRTNGQARPLEMALRRAGVRYHVVGGQSLFDRREVRDLLAYLRVFVNPHDDISLLRIANVPARGLSEATMERLLAASHDRQCSVFSVMGDPARLGLAGRTQGALAAFVHWVEQTQARLKSASTSCLRGWAEGFLHEAGYLEDLRRSEKDPEAGENRVRTLMDLVASLDETDPGRPASDRLQTFLEDSMLDQKREDDEQGGDAVTLITMHSCKGLEYPHVHIVGLEDGLLPHARSKDAGTLDEERRLFYVAITRAQETLTLSHCAARKKHGQKVPRHPSQFLKELPPELLEDGASRQPVSVESGRSLFAGLKAVLEDV